MFPLTLAYSITAHKCQGQTFDGGVIIDFKDGYIINGSFYVAVTRVRSGDKLFLRNFDISYIKVTKGVEEKIENMREKKPYIFKKLYLDERVFEFDKDDMKIAYLNINYLLDSLHSEYVNADKNLMHIDLLCLSDTRLTAATTRETIEDKLPNWEIIRREDSEDRREHMGMLFLVPKAPNKKDKIQWIKFHSVQNIRGKNERVQVQAVHFVYYDEKITFIYSRTKPSLKEAKEIHEMTKLSVYILGDINLCVTEDTDEQKLELICGKNKLRHLNQITTVRGNQPDHILVAKDKRHAVHSDCYFNFASDHKAIVLRMSHFINNKIIDMKS